MVTTADERGSHVIVVLIVVFLMLCGRFFSAGSWELAILSTQSHDQVMPPCDCVANAMSSPYIHREYFATGVDFDEYGVQWNRKK
jgi:hypothetical protein